MQLIRYLYVPRGKERMMRGQGDEPPRGGGAQAGEPAEAVRHECKRAEEAAARWWGDW